MLEKPKFFSQGTEFSVIEKMFSKEKFAQRVLGDDGFVFKSGGEKWAVSSDISRENIHYDLKWSSLSQALEKAVVSNLSDLNAMGALPSYLFLNLSASKKWKTKEYNILKKCLRLIEKKYGVLVAGGDTIITSKESFFSITVMGKIPNKVLLRSNAKPGHRVYVSGVLGRASAGLNFLTVPKKKHSFFNRGAAQDSGLHNFVKNCRDYHLCPDVHFKLGAALGKCKKKVAAMDISDGLSSELNHLAKQSRCQIEVDLDKIPVPNGFPQFCQKKYWKKWALHGGEEYILVFTGDFGPSELYHLNKIAKIYPIGKVNKGKGVYLKNGKREILNPAVGFINGKGS